MMLPPYGKSIDASDRLICVYLGKKQKIYNEVKQFGPNTLAFFYPLDPFKYRWPIQGRCVLLLDYHTTYLDKWVSDHRWFNSVVLAISEAGASKISSIAVRPEYEALGEETISINHYWS